MNREIRVLLVDDSRTMRKALRLLLSQDHRLAIVGEAVDGEEVVRMAAHLKPDVISMDVRMPGLDGLMATRRIMETSPCAILVVSSHTDDADLNLSFNAIQAGAIEIIGKPKVSSQEELEKWGRKLCDAIVRVGTMPVGHFHPAIGSRRPATPLPGGPIDIFGLAASTGGPPVLAAILKGLPKDLPIPLLVAQHMTDGFAGGFLRWLDRSSPLQVEFAVEGKPPQPGRIYLAPDGRHLELDGKGVFLLPLPVGGVCPSGDRLFHSLAKVYGSRAGGAVLTGMGEDGGRGLLAIREKGGVTLGQDEPSCVIYGMPRFAKELGAVQREFSPEEMNRLIPDLCRRKM